jgi:hypothetical protein
VTELTFRCPYTNKPIKSGIEIDAESARRVQTLRLRVQCTHCGLHHDGVIGDGELREGAYPAYWAPFKLVGEGLSSNSHTPVHKWAAHVQRLASAYRTWWNTT